jgi:hypothetical protein
MKTHCNGYGILYFCRPLNNFTSSRTQNGDNCSIYFILLYLMVSLFRMVKHMLTFLAPLLLNIGVFMLSFVIEELKECLMDYYKYLMVSLSAGWYRFLFFKQFLHLRTVTSTSGRRKLANWNWCWCILSRSSACCRIYDL